MLIPSRMGDCSLSLFAAARPSSKLSTIAIRRSRSELLAYLIASSFSRAARFLKLSKSATACAMQRSRKRSRSACRPAVGSSRPGCGPPSSRGGRALIRLADRRLSQFSGLFSFGFGILHVLRTTIKVMSSFCGWPAAKLRTSSVRRAITPSALARAGADGSDHPFRAEFISVRIERLGDAIGVKHEAIIAFEGDGNVAGYPIEHVSAVNAEGHPGRLQNRNLAGRGAIEERRVVAAAREGHGGVFVVENHVGHADEHVLFDVGIKLALTRAGTSAGDRLARAWLSARKRQIAMISEAGTPLPETSAMTTPSRSSSTLM